jgi:hypothetical protein
MGKGKGSFLRLSCRLKKNFIFLEFLNLNLILLNRIKIFLKKKNNFNIKIIKKKDKNIFFKNRNICYYNLYKQY